MPVLLRAPDVHAKSRESRRSEARCNFASILAYTHAPYGCSLPLRAPFCDQFNGRKAHLDMASDRAATGEGTASTSALSAAELDLHLSLLSACRSDGPCSPSSSTSGQDGAGSARLTRVEELIKQGAAAWYEDAELGWSALDYAAEAGDADVVRFLLSHGAIWNAGQCSCSRLYASRQLRRADPLPAQWTRWATRPPRWPLR